MVKMFHGFPKPQNKFIRDMVYGIQATGDTIITDIARAVAPEDKHRNVENRLSRNLQAEGLHEKIRDAMRAVDRATDGRGVRKDVLVAHIEHMHQRFNEVPEFFLYALAAGIKRAFVRYGSWETKAAVKKKDDRQPTLPGWDELSYLGVG